ncbi:redoxin domain-containing protein [Sedimentibacter sp.]|uniref:redoxin domain-containing protein n=1 Tax=Sedimentibacter sp. TaxID=1960295 RepID=UPI0028A65833|nr:redoxin domain-containing protein [Sedimentibacter sp.]
MSTPNIENGHITIGRLAPDFTALSTHGPITLSDYRGKWVVLASEPGNFLATSTSSIVAASLVYNELQKRNTQQLFVTIDNVFSNNELLKQIYDDYGIIVPFPLIEDRDAEIAHAYGMINPDRIYEESVRDLFIINPEGRIRAILTYPRSVGRSSYEILRLLDALQLSEAYNVSTPTNWVPGDPVILPTRKTFYEGLNRYINSESSGIYCKPWYACYIDYNSLINNNKSIEYQE